MQADDRTNFVVLTDGRLMQLQPDGSYRRVPSMTDHARLDALTQEEIDSMPPDPDHPPLDDRFWFDADAQAGGEAVGLDADVLSYFRGMSADYRAVINGVLRDYIDAVRGK